MKKIVERVYSDEIEREVVDKYVGPMMEDNEFCYWVLKANKKAALEYSLQEYQRRHKDNPVSPNQAGTIGRVK